MRPQDVARLLLLSALWGGSFIFMRIASPAFGPICAIEIRVLVAAIALLSYARLVHAPLELKTYWREYLVIGALNSAIPFALICWAELFLTASMAAILNAMSPLFAAIVAALWLRDRVTPSKLCGLIVSFVGVAILVGWSPIPLTGPRILAISGSLAAALSYGIAANYTKLKLKGAPAIGLSVCSQFAASLFLLPLVPFEMPNHAPSLAPWVCLLSLALASTAFAYVLFYRLVVDVGPTKALTVTFLAPIFGVLWGSLFLDEPLTVVKGLACAVILSGTALVTGVLGSKASGVRELSVAIE